MPFGDWYFNEFSTVWLIGAIVVAVINRMGEKQFVSVFAEGARDLVGVVLVLAASRGISIFMGSSEEGMSITFIYWIQNILSSVPLWALSLLVSLYTCSSVSSCSPQAALPESPCRFSAYWHLRCSHLPALVPWAVRQCYCLYSPAVSTSSADIIRNPPTWVSVRCRAYRTMYLSSSGRRFWYQF